MNKYKEAILERIKQLKMELSLEPPEWYNPHDFASGHWKGRVGVLRRELAWLEGIVENDASA